VTMLSYTQVSYITNLITFCRRLPAISVRRPDWVKQHNRCRANSKRTHPHARRFRSCLLFGPKILAPAVGRTLETKFHIPARIAVGQTLFSLSPEDVGAVITTYHSAWMYLDQIPENRFDMLVLDERRISFVGVKRSIMSPSRSVHRAIFAKALEKGPLPDMF